MDLNRKMAAALELAGRLEVTVRREPLDGSGGGLCLLKGRRLLFLDASADLATQFQCCLSALAQLPEIDGVFVIPELRDEMDRLRRAEG